MHYVSLVHSTRAQQAQFKTNTTDRPPSDRSDTFGMTPKPHLVGRLELMTLDFLCPLQLAELIEKQITLFKSNKFLHKMPTSLRRSLMVHYDLSKNKISITLPSVLRLNGDEMRKRGPLNAHLTTSDLRPTPLRRRSRQLRSYVVAVSAKCYKRKNPRLTISIDREMQALTI